MKYGGFFFLIFILVSRHLPSYCKVFLNEQTVFVQYKLDISLDQVLLLFYFVHQGHWVLEGDRKVTLPSGSCLNEASCILLPSQWFPHTLGQTTMVTLGQNSLYAQEHLPVTQETMMDVFLEVTTSLVFQQCSMTFRAWFSPPLLALQLANELCPISSPE